jgi:type I restriction enzyme S subunit
MTAKRQWCTQAVGDLRAKTKHALAGGPFGSNLVSRDYVDKGVPVIRGCNLPDDAPFSLDNLVFVSERKADALRPNNALPGDLVFTQRGTLGQVGIIPKDSPYSRFVISQSQMKLTVDHDKAVARYLYYYFRLPSTVERINGLAISSGVPHINLDILRKLQVITPPVPIQKRIAAILSAYDELIENNKRRLTLLERLAEELYREWFVRFRFPGHEKTKLVKGVPNGWSTKKFHEIVKYYIGGGWGEDNQTTTFCEGAFVIRGTDIPDVEVGELERCPFRFHKPSSLKSRTLQPNDFVFEVSGGSKDQLLGRNVFLTDRVLRFFDAPAIAASFCKLIRFRDELVSPYFMKYFMKLYYDYDLVGIYQVQSTGISNYQFESFLKFQTIILPPDELQEEFEDKVRPLIDMRDELALANIALRRTRDILLPRLISGKVSVENLDIQFPLSMAEETKAGPGAAAHA